MAKKATKKKKPNDFKKILSYFLGLGLILASVFLVSYDWQHKDKCEWYLIPDTTPGRTASAGMIPVCARNFVVNKQNCRLQVKESFAKRYFKKKFVLDEMRVSADGSFPREVIGIDVCQE